MPYPASHNVSMHHAFEVPCHSNRHGLSGKGKGECGAVIAVIMTQSVWPLEPPHLGPDVET